MPIVLFAKDSYPTAQLNWPIVLAYKALLPTATFITPIVLLLKDEKPNGQGTAITPKGAKYVGEFKNGRPNGQGTLTLPTGTKYVGEFKDGKPNGQATMTTPDGAKYVGEFEDGEFNLHEKTKKVDKKEYKPQCDNPKMAELLKQNANSIKPLNDNSSNSSSANSFEQNKKFNQNFNQTYSRDPLLNKFFESYNLYAQSTALLMEAYGKDQEAAIIRQSIIDSKNPNKGDQEKFSNSLAVVSEKSNNLKDLIYCRTEPLSATSKKKIWGSDSIRCKSRTNFCRIKIHDWCNGQKFKTSLTRWSVGGCIDGFSICELRTSSYRISK